MTLISIATVFYLAVRAYHLRSFVLFMVLKYIGLTYRRTAIVTTVLRVAIVTLVYNTSHKKFTEWKQMHVWMKTSKTNLTRWEWHHNTFTPSLQLVPLYRHLHKYALCLLVVCREGLWKAVWWVVLHVHVDAHCSCYTEHGRYGLSCSLQAVNKWIYML